VHIGELFLAIGHDSIVTGNVEIDFTTVFPIGCFYGAFGFKGG
jgi:hypothetical protein